jgi:SAM-dependent methyltransferase
MLTSTTHWDAWPKWSGDSTFQTPQFRFSCSTTDYSGTTNADTVTLLKDRDLLNLYRDLTSDGQTQSILELGFFQGGMPLFLADMIAPRKIVAIDWNQPSDALTGIVERHGLPIELVGGVDQADTNRIRSIVEASFGTEPLDIIIDDCSHYYPQTKACFEALFGYLRPGGKYIIEDWGWSHWPGEPWQTSKNPFHGKPSMTNLAFELTMALASANGTIAGMNIANQSFIVITRGDKLNHGQPLNLKAMTNIYRGCPIGFAARRPNWLRRLFTLGN